jgi:uncharacterized protein with ACT and thioredoxin-like domain
LAAASCAGRWYIDRGVGVTRLAEAVARLGNRQQAERSMAELSPDEKRALIYSGERIKKLQQEQDSVEREIKSFDTIKQLTQQQQIDKIYCEERVKCLLHEKQGLESVWIKLTNKQGGPA